MFCISDSSNSTGGQSVEPASASHCLLLSPDSTPDATRRFRCPVPDALHAARERESFPGGGHQPRPHPVFRGAQSHRFGPHPTLLHPPAHPKAAPPALVAETARRGRESEATAVVAREVEQNRGDQTGPQTEAVPGRRSSACACAVRVGHVVHGVAGAHAGAAEARL